MKRIQLRRTRGWRKPAGAIVVSRPSRWGNPFRIGQTDPYLTSRMMSRERAVEVYRLMLVSGYLRFTENDVRRELRGKDLACWCPTTEDCHADVLLKIANEECP